MSLPCPICASHTLVFCSVYPDAARNPAAPAAGPAPAAFPVRRYQRCTGCGRVSLDPSAFPDREFEGAHYRMHDNRADDLGLRRFVAPLVDAVRARHRHGGEVLDFGCGAGPAAGAMLHEAGFSIALFDPLFHPDRAVLERCYDVIVVSEVIEHLHDVVADFQRLRQCLRHAGSMAIRTEAPPPAARFARWHYRRDPTHVAFYPPPALRALARRLGLEATFPAPSVSLLSVTGR